MAEMTKADLEIAAIRKKRKHLTFEAETQHWLDIGSPHANAVFGSEKLGIPFDKIMEIYGRYSNGKTLLALFLIALAQRKGVKTALVDLENSSDEIWARSQGVDWDWLYVFRPEVAKVPGEKHARLETAQELFQHVEDWMEAQYAKNPEGSMMVVVDSVASVLVAEEAEAGLTGQNMRTSQARAKFMYSLMRRWVGLARTYNCCMIFINHLLMKPGKVWGSPEYRPSGDAMNYFAHIHVKVGKAKKIMHEGRQVGIEGEIQNTKNKAGGGSYAHASCGFRTMFGKKQWKFPPINKSEDNE